MAWLCHPKACEHRDFSEVLVLPDIRERSQLQAMSAELRIRSPRSPNFHQTKRWHLWRLKCNREKPCQNCVVRGESTSSCSYAERAEKKNGLSNSRSEAEVMRQRLNRLENSILSIMSEKSSRERSLSNAPSTSPHPSQGSEERHSDTSQHAGTHSISLDTRSTHVWLPACGVSYAIYWTKTD